MSKIVILGTGAFGLSIAIMAVESGHSVTMWSAFESEIESLKRDREHKDKLPGVKIPESIDFTADISCVSDADIVVIGVPSIFVRKVVRQAAPFIKPEMIIVDTSKGLEDGTYLRMSEVIREEVKDSPIVALSGPSHAEEVSRKIPTAISAASDDEKAAIAVQEAFSNDVLRIYLNDDVIGCELGGSLKNIIALCAGICDGLGYGDNTIAALMTRGITEIARLGVAMGARLDTFFGLTGIGDLIVTCTSLHSRNRRAGTLIGQGVSPDEAVKQVGTVEGYYCCKAAYGLAQKMNVEMPITAQLFKILFEGGDINEPIKALMNRPSRYEREMPLK
ncbi:MAG: NAD(P)-dependent glycerol-3-phosphate dehydrogenase [Oscillospiraceae bacterium]|jgi:glycerol-3-phosphate dehydrogenase (NAD(P)+)|nr:NAD(P)-dependent glycerol-3-phosphate dehydrogenase [Oscillospiraceae bacterium]MBR6836453.1 NAD(P)-dependent glycerol-3-phosphate dehydrogenase [Oscillospiraceae bacterium]MBR6924616.1 NAD(P)-dependent glycerol-3-phosphate dehydrogenase [Oscillospiraceae bacterium]